MLITTLFALQRQQTGFRGNLLAVNVPVVSYTRKPADVARFYQEAIRRISELPGVERVALGTAVPWRDPGFFAAQRERFGDLWKQLDRLRKSRLPPRSRRKSSRCAS